MPEDDDAERQLRREPGDVADEREHVDHAGAADAPFLLCSLLWARPGLIDALVAYEDRVLDLLPDHGIEVIQRTRIDGGSEHPVEMHLYEVPSQTALDAYLGDPRRVDLAAERDRVVARTEVFRVPRK